MSPSIDTRIDADGIGILNIGQPLWPACLIGRSFVAGVEAVLEQVMADPRIKGVVITFSTPSGPETTDPAALSERLEELTGQPADRLLAEVSHFSQMLRRLETGGKPVAAAIGGTVQGAGFELALACHYRVAAADPAIRLGLPEARIGLLPGGGGTQRVPRLIGIAAALPLLLEGRALTPDQARAAGLVHAVVPSGDMLDAAKRWLLDGASAMAPWDAKNYQVPGGAGGLHPGAVQTFTANNARAQDRTRHNDPAALAILSCVYEGTQLPFDRALRIESKYGASLFRTPVARNMIRTLVIGRARADDPGNRPAGAPRGRLPSQVGVLGDGAAGGAIAYLAARSGFDVVLIGTSREAAERVRDQAASRASRDVAEDRLDREAADALLARIVPADHYEGLADAGLVIDAVEKGPALKTEMIRRAEAAMPPAAILVSENFGLPLVGLAGASRRPDRFIGIHFPSFEDGLPLVEVVRTPQASDETVARLLDLVRTLGRTPIVIRDGAASFTGHLRAAYIGEGAALLRDGVKPALIENAARIAGMREGPLRMADRIGLDRSLRLLSSVGEGEAAAAHGDILGMLVGAGRSGAETRKGFYDYPESGPECLWPGLTDRWPWAVRQPDMDEVRRRLVHIQVLEAVRCLDEGMLADPADGDLGAVLGVGFAPHIGGPLSLVDGIGAACFVSECEELAERHGERFRPPEILRRMAARGIGFHPGAQAMTAAL